MPRGGARRRKSIDLKASANVNGMLVSSPTKGGHSCDSHRSPNTPRNRRDSALWMHTPSDQADDDEDDDDIEWSKILLTPVPKTPAPGAIARYAAEIPETPTAEIDYETEDCSAQDLLMRTCPPKANQYRELGEGILARSKDEQVVMRLLAAKRKSLQFAPKVGSPLSKAWK